MSQSPKKSITNTLFRSAQGRKSTVKPSNREFEVVDPFLGPLRFTRKQIRDAVRLVHKREAAKGK